MKILVIYSHSYPEQSVSGKAILEVFGQDAEVAVRNLEELYPEGTAIDVATEQAELVRADVIVFQHPVFWFNIPSRLKRWMDDVLQYGFAYGTGGDKLHGKKFYHSYTTGAPSETYAKGSELEQALQLSVKTSALYCGMDYQGAFPCYGQLALTNPNTASLAKAHAEALLSKIKA